MKKIIALFGILLLLPVVMAAQDPNPDDIAKAPDKTKEDKPTPLPTEGDSGHCRRGFALNEDFKHLLKDLALGKSVPYIPGMFKWACFG